MITGPSDTEPTRSDTELVVLARTTEPDAYGELFDRWYSPVHAVVLSSVGDHDTASNIAHDAFALCWRNLAKLEEPASFGGWVMRIGQTLGERRAGIDPDRRDALPAAVAVLGDRDRTMFELNVRQGLDKVTIASVVGLSAGAAEQRVADMLERARPAVDAAVGVPPTPEAPSLSKHHAAEQLVGEGVPIGRSGIAAHAVAELGANERFEAALGAVLGAVAAEDAAAEQAPGVAPAAGVSTVAAAPHSGARRRVLAGAAVLVVVIGVVFAWSASSDSTDEVVAGAATTTTNDPAASAEDVSSTTALVAADPGAAGDATSTTVAGGVTTSTARSATTTTKPRTGTTIVSQPGGVIASGPSDVPTTTVPTSAAPTTTVPPLSVNFGLGNASQPASGYPYPDTTSPSLSWSVSGPPGLSVTVVGPGVNSAVFNGSLILPCPGRIEGSQCISSPVSRTYTLTVKDDQGTVLTTRSGTLTIS